MNDYAGLREALARTTDGKWGKGRTTHETVSRIDGREPYRIAEFHHADDAEFCDQAHALVGELLAELDSTRDERDALRADAATHKERSEFLLRATREAQDLGSMWTAEVLAWRARFPKYTYRRQDDCVALAARSKGEGGT